MSARTAVTAVCWVAVALAACDEPPKGTVPSPSAAPVATATATAPKPAASAAAPAPSASAAPGTCDVTIVPGESIGDTKLAGTPSVQVEAEASKSYCVFGTKLTAQSTLVDIKAAAPQTCTQAALIGATHLNCDEDGVSLTFAGPQAVFHHVTIYPKGSPAPGTGKPTGKPPTSK